MSGALGEGDSGHRQLIGPYVLGKTVGKGQYGKVKRAMDTRTKREVAVKCIKRSKVSARDQVMLDREVRIHQLLQHPNIVNVLDAIEMPGKMLYVVCEYCPRGEIFDYLLAHGRLRDSEARRFFRELVMAVDYCHSFGFVHRDLKLENILLDSGFHVKLTDFGFTRIFDMDHYLTTSCGSPLYASPEILNGSEYRGPEVDIWSLGVVLYALVVGAMPYMYETPAALRTAVNAGVRFAPSEYLSPNCHSLVDRLLTLDPTKRITMNELRCHPWIVEDGLPPIPASRPECAVVTPDSVNEEIIMGLSKLGFKDDDIERNLFATSDNAIRAVYQLFLLRLRSRAPGDKRALLEPKICTPDGKAVPEGNVAAHPPSPIVKRLRRFSLNSSPLPATSTIRRELALDPAVVAKLDKLSATRPTITVPASTTPVAMPAGESSPKSPATSNPTSPQKSPQRSRGEGLHSLPGRIRQRRMSEDSDTTSTTSCSPPKPRAPLEDDLHGDHSEMPPGERVPFVPKPLGEMGRRATVATSGGATLLSSIAEEPTLHPGGAPDGGGHDGDSPSSVPGYSQPDTGRSSGSRTPPVIGEEFPAALPSGPRTTSLRLAARRTSSPEARATLKEAARRATQARAAAAAAAAAPSDKSPVDIFPIPAPGGRAGRRHSVLPSLGPEVDMPVPVIEGSPMSLRGPRPVRVAFSAQTTSSKPPAVLLRNVKDVLRRRSITYDESDGSSEYLLNCRYKSIEFEVEVCQIPRLSLHCLRFARKSGDVWLYKDIHNQIVPALDL